LLILEEKETTPPITGGLPFNSVGVYRVRSVDSKSDVWLQKQKLHHPAKLGKII
jgi:hypothetical protein